VQTLTVFIATTLQLALETARETLSVASDPNDLESQAHLAAVVRKTHAMRSLQGDDKGALDASEEIVAITVERRYAHGDADRFPEFAAAAPLRLSPLVFSNGSFFSRNFLLRDHALRPDHDKIPACAVLGGASVMQFSFIRPFLKDGLAR
jgi:hypothetical protein